MVGSRIWATLLFLGGGILLYRALALIYGNAAEIMVPWVLALLYLELALVLATMAACAVWALRGGGRAERGALRLAAALVMVHAVRVLIFMLGRTGPWIDFDVAPEQRAAHATRWTWGEVWFAVTMALLSIVVTVLVWRRRRATKRAAPHGDGPG